MIEENRCSGWILFYSQTSREISREKNLIYSSSKIIRLWLCKKKKNRNLSNTNTNISYRSLLIRRRRPVSDRSIRQGDADVVIVESREKSSSDPKTGNGFLPDATGRWRDERSTYTEITRPIKYKKYIKYF